MNILATITKPLERLPGLGRNASTRETIVAFAVYTVVLGGIAVILLGLLFWAENDDPDTIATDPTPTPEVAETPTPLPEPTATPTIEPDLTPTPVPTPEPDPTPTVAPDPTPRPDPEIAEELSVEQYLQWIEDMWHALGSSLGYFGQLTSDPRPDDPEWRAEIEGELELWRSLYESAESIIPPDELVNAHEKVTTGLDELVAAADLIESYLDERESDVLDEAQALIDAAIDLIRNGLDKIEQRTDPK